MTTPLPRRCDAEFGECHPDGCGRLIDVPVDHHDPERIGIDKAAQDGMRLLNRGLRIVGMHRKEESVSS